MRRWSERGALACSVALVLSCSGQPKEPREVELVAPCTPTDLSPDLGPDVVWGWADLHTHPAGAWSFPPRGLLWAAADYSPDTDPNVLPAIPPCPVETHAQNGERGVAETGGPFDRTAHTLILPLLNSQKNFTHAPIGDAEGSAALDAWPNARDVLHQSMPLASIYRAYRGGLRLLFASVTDNQALASLLVGPHFADGFASRRDREIESARRQLERIQTLTAESGFMEIARDPAHARDIIGRGRLAVLLSLEMEGLEIADIVALDEEFPIAHVIAIHLVDNDVGGTAASDDIFNASTALLSDQFDRGELSYIRVLHTDRTRGRLGWPMRIVEPDVPLLFDLGDISLPWYRSLGYESLCDCETSDVGPERLTGHTNALGLDHERGGAQTLRQIMSLGLMLDVSHMSYAAVDETLRLADSFRSGELPYPLLATHGDISYEGRVYDSERALALEHARRIARPRRGGVRGMIGLGTTGGSYDTNSVLVARGAPLLELYQAGDRVACGTLNGTSGRIDRCLVEVDVAPPLDMSIHELAQDETRLRSLVVEVDAETAWQPAGEAPQIEVELLYPCVDGSCRASERAGVSTRLVASFSCAGRTCRAEVAIPSAIPRTRPDAAPLIECRASDEVEIVFHARDIARIALRGRNRCRTRQSEWRIRQADIRVDGTLFHQVALGRGAGGLALTESRHAIVLYEREDHRWPTEALASDNGLLRVRVRPSPGADELPSAGVGRIGTNVCMAIATRPSGCDDCPCNVPLDVRAVRSGCPDGWFGINQRGVWQSIMPIDVFISAVEPSAIDRVCGFALSVDDWDVEGQRWAVDEVRVERMSDPALDLRDSYRRVDGLFEGEAGHVAFGTDFNGFAPQLPIAVVPDWSAPTASVHGCAMSEGLRALEVARGDGSRAPLRLDERGLATFGMLSDMIRAVDQSTRAPGEARVADGLFLSAERALRVWAETRRLAGVEE